jgi:uncharacterized protein (DUF1800 family)
MTIAWNREAAAHLARRAGFGATPAELDQFAQIGLDATVDRFVNYDGIDNAALEADLSRLTTIQPGQTAPSYDLTRSQGLQRWFLHRMVHTARPLEEKMTYFWNQLFTTSFAKVNDATLMLNQNQTQRRLAVARFDELVLAMTKDPAMLIWLDNATSTKNRPNENYARELMELFTMGEGRGYTETDVKEVARALTGWTITRPPGTPASQYTFFFNAGQHDFGTKTVLGQTGTFDGAEVIDIILRYTDANGNVSGRFLAEQLWTFFGYPEPPSPVVEQLRDVYVSSSHSIRAMLHYLFHMEEFYETHTRRRIVRGPVEYMVSTLKMLQATSDFSAPANALNPMGQFLFYPEDARGWEAGLRWVNTGTVFARASFANTLSTNRGSGGTRIDPAALVAGRRLDTAADVVAAVAERLGLADSPAPCKAVWERYVSARDDGTRGTWQNTPANVDKKVRGLIHVMLTSPDFQFS